MKIHTILFIAFLNISFNCFGQIKIVDSTTGDPIQSVSIIINNGILIGISDGDGKFNFTGISNDNKLTDTTLICFTHISYENYYCRLKDIYTKVNLNLVPKNNELATVVINSKGINNDYLVFYGYYRSYAFNEKKIFGFADGIIEYYIPLYGSEKIGKNYIANRLYEKKEEKDIKQSGIYKAGIDVNPGVPFIDKKFILDQIMIPYLKVKLDESKTMIYDKNKNEIGSINFDNKNNTNKISIDLLKIDTNKDFKFLGIKVKYINQNITETYHNNNNNNNLINNKEDLISYSSRYKSDYFFKNISIGDERIQEFIVFEKRYISKSEFKEIKNGNHFRFMSTSPSSFNVDFIDECFKKYNIPDIPSNIKSQFNNTLIKK
jgi:hypothetical protein